GTEEAPWCTIQHAADTLTPDSIVYVKPGVYDENVVITVSGEEGLPIVYSAYDHNELPQLVSAVTGEGLGISIGNDVSYIGIDGFSIRDYAKAIEIGENANNIEITQDIINENVIGIEMLQGSNGIIIENVTLSGQTDTDTLFNDGVNNVNLSLSFIMGEEEADCSSEQRTGIRFSGTIPTSDIIIRSLMLYGKYNAIDMESSNLNITHSLLYSGCNAITNTGGTHIDTILIHNYSKALESSGESLWLYNTSIVNNTIGLRIHPISTSFIRDTLISTAEGIALHAYEIPNEDHNDLYVASDGVDVIAIEEAGENTTYTSEDINSGLWDQAGGDDSTFSLDPMLYETFYQPIPISPVCGAGYEENDIGSVGCEDVIEITAGPEATVDGNTATIEWTTNIPGDSLVKYSTEAGQYTSEVHLTTNVEEHTIIIDTLSPNTYYYVVNSTDEWSSDESVEHEFTIEQQLNPPVVTLIEPDSGEHINESVVFFNCTASDASGIQTIKLFTNISGTWAEEHSVSTDVLEFTKTSVADGSYIWNCFATDTTEMSAWATNRTFFVQKIEYEINMSFSEGYSLMSIPIFLSSMELETVFDSFLDDLLYVYAYDNGWEVYRHNENFTELETLENNKAYFIGLNDSASFSIRGHLTDGSGNTPALGLDNGWNLVGIHNVTSMKASAFLGGLLANVQSMWKYDSGYHEINENETIYPTRGYWVRYADTQTHPTPSLPPQQFYGTVTCSNPTELMNQTRVTASVNFTGYGIKNYTTTIRNGTYGKLPYFFFVESDTYGKEIVFYVGNERITNTTFNTSELTELNLVATQCDYQGASCGNGACESGETCNNCEDDCGPCDNVTDVTINYDLSAGNTLETKQELQDALEDMWGSLTNEDVNNYVSNSQLISSDLDTTINLHSDSSSSELTFDLTNAGNLKINNMLIYLVVPKEFSQQATDVTITTAAEYRIVESDPEFGFLFDLIDIGDDFQIVLSTETSTEQTAINSVSLEAYAESADQLECNEYETQCNQNTLETCIENQWVFTEQCDLCSESPARCVDVVCNEGESRCLDDEVQVCQSGEWTTIELCESGCFGGSCSNFDFTLIIIPIIIIIIVVVFLTFGKKYIKLPSGGGNNREEEIILKKYRALKKSKRRRRF
ncbi:hypothetical protein ACFLQN_03930, partial [Candidatus Aenigmatarchaeota archaeon]